MVCWALLVNMDDKKLRVVAYAADMVVMVTGSFVENTLR